MRILLFGATGMVGYGVLRECLVAADVDEVVTVGRAPLGRRHAKLTEIVVPDVFDLSTVADRLIGFDACFFCLGVTSVGMSEPDYRRITHDLTLSVAGRLVTTDPGMTFVYVTGAGTDAHGRQMWARVKGTTENALLAMDLNAYMFRPGLIDARYGARTKTAWYRALYTVLGPLISLARTASPRWATSTDAIGLAMLTLARHGSPEQIFGNGQINALAAT